MRNTSTNWSGGSVNSSNWSESSKPSTNWTGGSVNSVNWEDDDPSAGFLLLENGDNVLREEGNDILLQ